MSAATTVTAAGPWAEDLFLHGHLLGRWITDYVDLEESLAVGSIAQEEMAHANALLEADGLDDTRRDQYVFLRDPAEWHPARLLTVPNDTWPAVVARGYLLAAAMQVRISGLLGTGAHADLARVLQAEQDLHRVHWQRWLRILTRDPDTRPQIADALSNALSLSGDILSGTGEITDQITAGHERWTAEVTAELDSIGIAGVGAAPCVRRASAADAPSLVDLLRTVARLRTDPNDRVKGLYR